MLFPQYQNWRTSILPYSLSLANSVHTGVTYTTPSGSVAESKRWATRGFQGFGGGFSGHGPRVQYPNRGLDGMGCGCGGSCGCGGGGGGDGFGLLLCVAAAAAALFFFAPRRSEGF